MEVVAGRDQWIRYKVFRKYATGEENRSGIPCSSSEMVPMENEWMERARTRLTTAMEKKTTTRTVVYNDDDGLIRYDARRG